MMRRCKKEGLKKVDLSQNRNETGQGRKLGFRIEIVRGVNEKCVRTGGGGREDRLGAAGLQCCGS